MDPVSKLPTVALTAHGALLRAADIRGLSQVRVQQRLSLPTLCELIFCDPPGPLEIAAVLGPGTRLDVAVSGHATPLFAGEVTALEHVYGSSGEQSLHVRGYDLLHRLRKRLSARVHVQVSLPELARDLTADLGLAVRGGESSPVWPQVIQYWDSDLEMLRALAEECGLYPYLRGNVLHLLTLKGTGDSVMLSLGNTLLEARVEVNGELACGSVQASGWNPLRVETYRGRAASARLGREVASRVTPAHVGADAERELVHESARNSRHIEGLAQAELDRRAAHTVTLWGLAEGDPRLQPGTAVLVQGIGGAVSGRYVLTSVTHTIDASQGFVSELSSAPPAPARRERGTSAALGKVTRVDDPENLGRIQVSLPTYSDAQSEWMHVVSPGAGPDKGLMALPDVDDEVLVLLAQGDPAQGIVLGGLYGMGGPPDSGVEGNSVCRYTLRTPSGHTIRLDDAKGILRVEDSNGSHIELSPQRMRVHAAVDLEIEAPGQTVTIRGQRINFERG